jgi:hypothetical protein
MTALLNHPPGELIDIGGYRLKLHRTGQGAPPAVSLSTIARSP